MILSSKDMTEIERRLLPICHFEMSGGSYIEIPARRMIPPNKGDMIQLQIEESLFTWEVESVIHRFVESLNGLETTYLGVTVNLSYIGEEKQE